MSIDSNIEEFWTWLGSHRANLDQLRHPSEPFWDVILEQLKRVCEGIWFELGRHKETNELVFTAHGDRDVFPAIDALVAASPHWPAWTFTALKPIAGMTTRTTGDGLDLDPRGFWIMRLRHRTKPSFFGIRVAIPGFKAGGDDTPWANAAWRVADGLLGERRSATEIDYLEVCEIPDDPESEGYAPMEQLPELMPK